MKGVHFCENVIVEAGPGGMSLHCTHIRLNLVQ